MPSISGGDIFQYSLYVGLNFQDIFYGVELVLYSMTMFRLLNHPGKISRSDVFYAIFSSVIVLHFTIWIITQAVVGQKMWLSPASFPSGASSIWEEAISTWYMDMATISLTVLQLLTDALMVYRCWMVCNSYRVILIPSILWTADLVLGILVMWITTTSSGGVYFHNTAAQIGLAFYCCSVILTVMVTGLICYRVLRFGRLVKEHLPHEYASPYFAVVVLVVECVLPYSLAGIAFVISLGLGSQLVSMFGYLYASTMCVSPQMLILRVATGTAWTKDTYVKQPRSTLKFSPQENTTSGSIELRTIRDTDTGVDLESGEDVSVV